MIHICGWFLEVFVIRLWLFFKEKKKRNTGLPIFFTEWLYYVVGIGIRLFWTLDMSQKDKLMYILISALNIKYKVLIWI